MSRSPRSAQAFAQAGEGVVSAEVGVDVIVADGEAGPADVGLLEVRQDAVIFRQPLGIRRRHAARGLAGLPDAEEPDQVEPVAGELVQLRLGDVVQGRRTAERGGQLRQADAGVDLEERGIAGRGHRCLLFFPAHLLPDEARLEPFLRRQQHVGCVDAAEEVQQAGDDSRPTGLVAGPEAGPVVPVEVLVEEDQVTPVRVLLELRGAAVDGAAPALVPEEDAGEPSRDLLAPPRRASSGCRSRWGTRR